MSRIVTFYSYKGGVGRTFALANIAVLLSRRGLRVLVIDWDLEAPGLHRYFHSYLPAPGKSDQGLALLLKEAYERPDTDWRSHVVRINLGDNTELTVLRSGDHCAGYADCVRTFDWAAFFRHKEGGATLERWRAEWKESFDFVLVDSRTGITDAGGVCTILLPDVLVFVFTANEQSFGCGKEVVCGIQKARRELAVHRPPAAVLPLLGRFDGREEVDEAARWLDRFAVELKPFYDEWLPKRFAARQILELTKIPYIAKFSFGEPLPVISQGTRDPDGPGFYLEKAAALLASDFYDVPQLLEPKSVTAGHDARLLFELLKANTSYNGFREIMAVVEESRGLATNGNFEGARARVRNLPESSEPLAGLKGVLLQQLDEAERQHSLRRLVEDVVEKSKKLLAAGKLEEARSVVRSLPDEPTELVALKENLLGQIDQAVQMNRLSSRIDELIEESKALVSRGRFEEARTRIESLPNKPNEVARLREQFLSQIAGAEKDWHAMVDNIVQQINAALRVSADTSALRQGLIGHLREGLPPQQAAEALAKDMDREPTRFFRPAAEKIDIAPRRSLWKRIRGTKGK